MIADLKRFGAERQQLFEKTPRDEKVIRVIAEMDELITQTRAAIERAKEDDFND